MDLVERLISIKGSFFVHDCNIYTIDIRGRDGSIKGKTLSKLCKVEDAKHAVEGNFQNTHKFLHNAVVPLLAKSASEDKEERNHYFDKIHPRHLPLGLGANNFHFYVEDTLGDLELSNKRFKKIGQKPRSAFHANYPKVDSHKIEIEKRGNKYILSEKLNPFFMVNKGERYLFQNMQIAMEIQERGNKLKINEPTMKRKTHHPFVYSDDHICFDGKKRWKRLGVEFKMQDINSSLLRSIGKVFNESKVNLIDGYHSNVSPVKSLNQRNFPNEYRGKAV